MGDTRDQPAPAAEPHDHLDVARRFLDDDDIRTAPRDKKADFLRSKGLSDAEISELLGKLHVEPGSGNDEKPIDDPDTVANATQQPPPSPPPQPPPSEDSHRAPVVTYPEFLARSPRSPPLVTTNGLLATFYGFAGLSTLLYGTSKYLVAPMVESLTDARSQLHDTASLKLQALISRLEETVSTIPSTGPPVLAADHASDAEDPTEMFHRDVGIQTSLPASPSAQQSPAAESGTERQARRLSQATVALSGLKDQLRVQSEDLEDVRTLLDVFRDDLDAMTYSSKSHLVPGYDIYGTAKKAEPQDEIRRVRDNIRLVKGALLSSRSFPASGR